jgi:hypothetical protein
MQLGKCTNPDCQWGQGGCVEFVLQDKSYSGDLRRARCLCEDMGVCHERLAVRCPHTIGIRSQPDDISFRPLKNQARSFHKLLSPL